MIIMPPRLRSHSNSSKKHIEECLDITETFLACIVAIPILIIGGFAAAFGSAWLWKYFFGEGGGVAICAVCGMIVFVLSSFIWVPMLQRWMFKD